MSVRKRKKSRTPARAKSPARKARTGAAKARTKATKKPVAKPAPKKPVANTGLKKAVAKTAPKKPVAKPSPTKPVAMAAPKEKRSRPRMRRPSAGAYVALVEHAAFGILQSDRQNRVLTANAALVKMLGYESPDELLAVPSVRNLLVNATDYVRLTEHFRPGGRLKGAEMAWRRKDGTPFMARLSGRAVTDKSGAFDGFEAIVEDVHDTTVLKAQLQQAQKMEAIGHLTGGIAHDFNNLLTVILATTDLATEQIPPEQGELISDLQNIRSAAQRGSDMARKLLGFSRRGEVILEPVKLWEVVAGTLAMLRPLLPETIRAQFQRDEVIGMIRADAGAIDQIVMNLVTNARDAMPAGGTLRVETRRAWLDEEHRRTHGWGEAGEYAALIVTDTGMGMDIDTRRRVFEPFFTTKATGAGTGLGMAMVFGLVKQHQGFVDVYSEPHEGTTVKAYFPVIPGEATYAEAETALQPPRGTETILLAEDDEAIRLSAQRILTGLGYYVLPAVDGEAALELIDQRDIKIDLVLTDIGMPRMNGAALHRAARRLGATMPFLFMSAYPATELRKGSQLDAKLPFLYKPWTMVELAIRVREELDQSATRRVLSGRSVLLVDDDPQTRAVLRARMEEAGCTVREAVNVDDALRIFRDARPDVIVTDMLMPGETGAVLIETVRREGPAQPIVAISGSIIGDRDALLEQARALGATQAMPKPFTTTQLLGTLRAALAIGDGR